MGLVVLLQSEVLKFPVFCCRTASYPTVGWRQSEAEDIEMQASFVLDYSDESQMSLLILTTL